MSTTTPVIVLALLTLPPALQAQTVKTLKDPVTARTITHYKSPQHEVHHYYFISPWSPDGKLINFFRFDAGVDKLTARGRFPGSLWVMNPDGSNRRQLVGGLKGNYHTGVNQFWGPTGQYVYYTDSSQKRRCMPRVDVDTGKADCVDETPVPCQRASADEKLLSCGTGDEWGVYDLREKRYKPLVTLERALALTPNKALATGKQCQLQNVRFNPTGDKAIIVNRTTEDLPALIEIYLYDFKTAQLTYLTHDLHHPAWRPDGKAVLFVRWDKETKTQAIWEIDVKTKAERPLFNKHHVSGVHTSYHPTKPHLIVTDCYGGDFGNGIALIDLKKNEMRQLVTIPLGSKPDVYPDERFPFRNWGLFMPPRKYLNEPRPVWSEDGNKLLYTSEESGHINLYVVDTSDL